MLMALIGNYSAINKSCGRFRAGASISDNRSNYNTNGSAMGFFVNEGGVDGVIEKSAVPNGYLPPYSWVLPVTGGGMVGVASGSGSLSGSGAMGVNADALLTGSGSISNAPLQLIVSATASLSGSGSISTAAMNALLQASASLSGTGSISTAAATAIGNVAASLSGLGSFSITAYATGNMSASIVIGDNPDSVLLENIEGDLTLKDSIRILLAVAAGKTTVSGGTVTFRDTQDAIDRVVAVVAASERTSVVLDAS